MGATFVRVKTWVKERLTYQDLNTEFDNILTNLTPSGVDDASATLGDMQAAVDPAPYVSGAQVPNLPTSLAVELQELRFMISKLSGQTVWYTDPKRVLSANSGDMQAYLNFDGTNTTDAVKNVIQRGIQLGAVLSNVSNFASSMLDSTNVKFGSYSFDLAAGSPANILALPLESNEMGSLSLHFRNLSAGDYIAYNPLLGIELFLDGAGLLTYRQTLAKATTSETAKDSLTVKGSVSRAGSTSFAHVLLRWLLNGSAGAGSDSLGLLYNSSAEGSQLVAQTAPINISSEGVWFFGAKPTTFTANHASSMKVLPTAEASNPWTALGNVTANTVSNGVLSLIPTAGAQTGYTGTTGFTVYPPLMSIEAKARLSVFSNQSDSLVVFNAAETTSSRRIIFQMYPGRVELTSNGITVGIVYLDTSVFNVYRVNMISDVFTIYINGLPALTTSLALSASVSSNNLSFYLLPATSSPCQADIEYFITSVTTVNPPVQGSTTGQLDDIALFKSSVSNNIGTQLSNNAAKDVFGIDVKSGVKSPKSRFTGFAQGTGVGAFGSTTEIYFNSDGITPIEFSFKGTSSSSNSVVIGVRLDDLYNLQSQSTVVPTGDLNFSGKRTFKAGLHKLGLYVELDSSGPTSVIVTGEFFTRVAT